MKSLLLSITAVLSPLVAQAAEQSLLQDKTLVAWVAPANLTQRGGSVLTLDDQDLHFDGIVFGEIAPAKWMTGSDHFRRTETRQDAWPTETTDANTFVQMALVYRGNEIIAYRNGVEYSRHSIREPQAFGAGSVALIGPRHIGVKDCFAGAVDDARIYDRALTAAEIAALKPDVEGAIRPWAWWTFDDAAAKDRAGRFVSSRLANGAKVEGGKLILDGGQAGFSATQTAAAPPVVLVKNPKFPDDIATAAPAAPETLFGELFRNPNPVETISVADGIGHDDPQHSFQDPSNVLKVGDTYYAWVSWRPLNVHLYNSVIHYATSKDGKKWEQKGLALGKGAAGSFDSYGVLTPYVAQVGGRFYMFYTTCDDNWPKGSGNAIGLAVADKPEGPWTRVSDRPVLAPSHNGTDWDSHINDDAHLLVRNGKFWLYYKGQTKGQPWYQTKQGVAIADKIEGPYVKHADNPVIKSGHCVCVWPHQGGVAAFADMPGEILWAADGLNFVMVKRGLWRGAGPGPYDPDAHNDAKFGGGIAWGIMQYHDPSVDNQERNVIARFDLDMRARE